MSSWPLQSVSIPNSFSLSRLLSHLHGFLTLSGAAIILLAHFYPSLFQKKRKHYYTIPEQIQIFVLSKGVILFLCICNSFIFK